jgi:hypothetical protein
MTDDASAWRPTAQPYCVAVTLRSYVLSGSLSAVDVAPPPLPVYKQPYAPGELPLGSGYWAWGPYGTARRLEILAHRRLIARAAHLGPRRERYWRTMPPFLETLEFFRAT